MDAELLTAGLPRSFGGTLLADRGEWGSPDSSAQRMPRRTIPRVCLSHVDEASPSWTRAARFRPTRQSWSRSVLGVAKQSCSEIPGSAPGLAGGPRRV